jgi:hypothetical protein
MENSSELKALIRKNAHLFWYIKDSVKEDLPLPVVMEFFFNYANEEDVRALIKLEGKQKLAGLFFEQINKSDRASNNYTPLAKNFFSHYFSAHA